MNGGEGAWRRQQDYMLQTGQWTYPVGSSGSRDPAAVEHGARRARELTERIDAARRLAPQFAAAMVAAGSAELSDVYFSRPRGIFDFLGWHDVVIYRAWVMARWTEATYIDRDVPSTIGRASVLTEQGRWHEVHDPKPEQCLPGLHHLHDSGGKRRITQYREWEPRHWPEVWATMARMNAQYGLGLDLGPAQPGGN